MRFDLRWKHALGLGLEDEGFDATVLCRFRRKLLERGLEQNLFERLVRAARGAGLIAEDAAQLLDSSHILGAAGARDTYALIRGAIRKLLRTLGHTTANRGTLSERLWWYMDPEAPEKPDIDWSDPEARAAHLEVIVRDAREALSLAQRATTASPAANAASALLSKIVSDDVEEGPPPPPKRKGRPPNKRGEEVERSSSQGHHTPSTDELLGPRLRRGVAKDRVLSVVDPQMRVGHKSKRQAWAGYKVHIAEEPNSELITEVGVRRANEYDAEAAPDLLKRQRESVGLRPKELLCDGAYGSADVRADLKKLGVEVVAKLRPLTDSKHFRKDEFKNRPSGKRRRRERNVSGGDHHHRLPDGSRRMVPSRQALPFSTGSVPEVRTEGGLPWRPKWEGKEPRAPPSRQAGSVALPRRGIARSAGRAADGRAEKGFAGEIEAPRESGAQDI